MVQADQMLVIREQSCILGILAADRQAENLLQISVVGIDLEDDNRIVTCIRAHQVFEIRRKVQGTGCGSGRVIIIECRYCLDLFEIRNSVDLLIEIDIDQVLELVHYIEIVAVAGELQMARSRIQFRMQDRTLSDLSCDIIEGIDIDVVHAEVCRTQIFVVARHLHALYMRPEIALRDTAQSLEEELVCDLADTAVFAQTQHRDLTVVIAAHEEVFIVIICGKMRSAHTVMEYMKRLLWEIVT